MADVESPTAVSRGGVVTGLCESRRDCWTSPGLLITLTACPSNSTCRSGKSFWSIVFVLGVGFVSGRILGVRRGFLRATAAGLIGSFIGLVIATIVLRDEAEITGEEIIPLAFGFALLATMVLSVVLEVLLRPRRRVKRALAADQDQDVLHGRWSAVRGVPDRPAATGSTGSVLTLEVVAGHPGGRPADSPLPRGLRRDVHQVRPDRLHPVGSGARTGTRRALRSAVQCQEGSDGADPGQDRERAGCADRGDLRVVLRRTTGRRLDRPDARRGCCVAASGWWSRSAVPMSRSASPAIRRCCAGRPGPRCAGRKRRGSLGLVALARRADQVGRPGTQLPPGSGERSCPRPRCRPCLACGFRTLSPRFSTDAVLVQDRVDGKPVSVTAAVDATRRTAGGAGRPAARGLPDPGDVGRGVPCRPAPGQHPDRPAGHPVADRLRGRRPDRPGDDGRRCT